MTHEELIGLLSAARDERNEMEDLSKMAEEISRKRQHAHDLGDQEERAQVCHRVMLVIPS